VEKAIGGTKRFLQHLGMLKQKFEVPQVEDPMICIETSSWISADLSGLFRSIAPYGNYVQEGETIAWITDPYVFVESPVLAPNSGYIINENQAPIVYQGDAIFNISTNLVP